MAVEIIDNRSSSREVDGADTRPIPFFSTDLRLRAPERSNGRHTVAQPEGVNRFKMKIRLNKSGSWCNVEDPSLDHGS